jgi:hypothetical protein
MQHSQVSFSKFPLARQNAAKAIHPTVGALHHPASDLETVSMLDGLLLLVTRF